MEAGGAELAGERDRDPVDAAAVAAPSGFVAADDDNGPVARLGVVPRGADVGVGVHTDEVAGQGRLRGTGAHAFTNALPDAQTPHRRSR